VVIFVLLLCGGTLGPRSSVRWTSLNMCGDSRSEKRRPCCCEKTCALERAKVLAPLRCLERTNNLDDQEHRFAWGWSWRSTSRFPWSSSGQPGSQKIMYHGTSWWRFSHDRSFRSASPSKKPCLSFTMSIDLSLSRIRLLLPRLPTYRRPTRHIAGTNGKASVFAPVSSPPSSPLSVG